MHLTTLPIAIRWVRPSRTAGIGGSYSILPASTGGSATIARHASTATPAAVLTVTIPVACSIRRTGASRTTESSSSSAIRREIPCEPPSTRESWAPPSVSIRASSDPAERM